MVQCPVCGDSYPVSGAAGLTRHVAQAHKHWRLTLDVVDAEIKFVCHCLGDTGGAPPLVKPVIIKSE